VDEKVAWLSLPADAILGSAPVDDLTDVFEISENGVNPSSRFYFDCGQG
jgi:hypothetical protein